MNGDIGLGLGPEPALPNLAIQDANNEVRVCLSTQIKSRCRVTKSVSSNWQWLARGGEEQRLQQRQRLTQPRQVQRAVGQRLS